MEDFESITAIIDEFGISVQTLQRFGFTLPLEEFIQVSNQPKYRHRVILMNNDTIVSSNTDEILSETSESESQHITAATSDFECLTSAYTEILTSLNAFEE